MSSADPRTFETARGLVLSVHNHTSVEDNIHFYDRWAQTYEQDVGFIEYSAPGQAASHAAAHFCGDRQSALVLDVACGTGMVPKMMKPAGFQHFVGVDASEGMLQHARQSGFYQDLKLAVVGEQPIPVPSGDFDVVIIAGALSLSHIPVKVIRELWRAAKQGGLICMTTRADHNNAGYKVALEGEIKQMEDEGLWRHVEVTNVSKFERAVDEQEKGYIPGCVYVLQKL